MSASLQSIKDTQWLIGRMGLTKRPALYHYALVELLDGPGIVGMHRMLVLHSEACVQRYTPKQRIIECEYAQAQAEFDPFYDLEFWALDQPFIMDIDGVGIAVPMMF